MKVNGLVVAVQGEFDRFLTRSGDREVVVSCSGTWLICVNATAGVVVSGVFNPETGWYLSGRALTSAGEPRDVLYTARRDLDYKVEHFGLDEDGDPSGAVYVQSLFSSALRETSLQLRVLPLVQLVPGLVVNSAGGACPVQAEGTLHGLPFYFRYRSAHATLSVSAPTGGEFNYFAPLYQGGMNFGQDYDGSLTGQEFQSLFLDLVRGLVRAPRLWEFTGAEVQDAPHVHAGDPRTYGAWGHTPQEAHTALVTKPNRWPDSLMPWEDYVQGMVLNPVSFTVDERVWPDPEPVFTVNTPASANMSSAAGGVSNGR